MTWSVRKFIWFLSLVGMLAIGTGGLRAMHHHGGDACGIAPRQVEPTHVHDHACDSAPGVQHARVPATPARDHHPVSGDDEEHCVTCQLISGLSNVGVDLSHSVALFVEPQALHAAATWHGAVISELHFDPHTPRGPPLA